MFRDTRIDWSRQKWFFLSISLIFSIAGLFSILFWHHAPLGIDFRGVQRVMVKFDSRAERRFDSFGARAKRCEGGSGSTYFQSDEHVRK